MGTSTKWICIVVILIVCLLPFLVPMLFGSGQNLDQNITISIPAPGSDMFMDTSNFSKISSTPTPYPSYPVYPVSTSTVSPSNVTNAPLLYSDVIQFKLSDCLSSKSSINGSIYFYYIIICLMYVGLFISFTDFGQSKYFSLIWLFIIAAAVGASVWRYGSADSIAIDMDTVKTLIAGKKLDSDQTKYFINQFQPNGSVGQTLTQLKNVWRVLFFVTSIILCVIGMGLTFYSGYKARPVLEPFLEELEGGKNGDIVYSTTHENVSKKPFKIQEEVLQSGGKFRENQQSGGQFGQNQRPGGQSGQNQRLGQPRQNQRHRQYEEYGDEFNEENFRE